MDQAARLDACEKTCRERGLAMTVQRRVILRELLERTDHPTADRIYESVRERLPGLSRTTVYRVLEAFVGAGVASKVFHPDAVARFDPVGERHHHLVCESCGRLFDLEAAAVGEVPLPRSRAGFVIHDYSINFTGLCSDCRRVSASSRSRSEEPEKRSKPGKRRKEEST